MALAALAAHCNMHFYERNGVDTCQQLAASQLVCCALRKAVVSTGELQQSSSN
jgi:hypothetical protein